MPICIQCLVLYIFLYLSSMKSCVYSVLPTLARAIPRGVRVVVLVHGCCM